MSNHLFASFATVARSLDATASALFTLRSSLETVASRALAEQERTEALLASLPPVPEDLGNPALADNLGLGKSLADLKAARQQLADHAGHLEHLAIQATIQSDQVHATRRELLVAAAAATPAARPSQSVQEPAPALTAVEPAPQPIAAPAPPQAPETATVLAHTSNGEPVEVVALVAALPGSEPVPEPAITTSSTPSEGEPEVSPKGRGRRPRTSADTPAEGGDAPAPRARRTRSRKAK
jgi:hypothetical protein